MDNANIAASAKSDTPSLFVELGAVTQLTGLWGTPVRDNPGAGGAPEYYDASKGGFDSATGEVEL